MPRKAQQCPCCGCYTLDKRGLYEICPVCFWEDDEWSEQYGQPAPQRPKGPNNVHLWQARQNFMMFGAAEEKDKSHVRKAQPDELP